MGLLDDAIREHLELKRLRGADPDELAREEDEALGDPRNPEPSAADAAAAPELLASDAAPKEAVTFSVPSPSSSGRSSASIRRRTRSAKR